MNGLHGSAAPVKKSLLNIGELGADLLIPVYSERRQTDELSRLRQRNGARRPEHTCNVGLLPSRWCVFHITNGIRPKSFLREDYYLAENFLTLMTEAEAEFGYDTLYTFTWLNSHPRFLRFFPEEWQRNLGEPHPGIFANMGFLGQFLNAKGTLNRKTAEEYLSLGELPYPPRKSHCSFASMRKHLTETILKRKEPS